MYKYIDIYGQIDNEKMVAVPGNYVSFLCGPGNMLN
jgi:hypothetical protein